VAQAIEFESQYMDRIDRTLASVEMRRNAALRDLAKYRDPLARKLRQAIAQEEKTRLAPDAPQLTPADPA
jgi:hypothetical protein